MQTNLASLESSSLFTYKQAIDFFMQYIKIIHALFLSISGASVAVLVQLQGSHVLLILFF